MTTEQFPRGVHDGTEFRPYVRVRALSQPSSAALMIASLAIPALLLVITVLLMMAEAGRESLLLLFWVYAAGLVGISALALHDWRVGRKRPGLLMLVLGIGYWYVHPALARLLTDGQSFGGHYSIYIDDFTLLQTTAALMLFALSGTVAYWVLAGRASVRAGNGRDLPVSVNRALLVLVGLLLVGLLPYIVSDGSIVQKLQDIFSGRFGERAWAPKGVFGDESSAIYYVGLAGLVSTSIGALSQAVLRRGLPLRSLFPFLLIALISAGVVYLDSGTRTWTVFCLAPALLLYLVRRAGSLELKHVALVLAALLALQLGTATQRLYRGYGSYPAAVSSLSWQHVFWIVDNNQFSEAAVAIRAVPAWHDYFRESILWQFVTSPIPRFLWSDKPVSASYFFYNEVTAGTEIYRLGSTKLPSVIGQFYMNWGYAGVVQIGLLYGIFLAYADRTFLYGMHLGGRNMLAAAIIVWLFLQFRHFAPGWAYPFAFLMLMQLALFKKGGASSEKPSAFA